MDLASVEQQINAMKAYNAKGHSSVGAEHVETALVIITGFVDRIEELTQANDELEAAFLTVNEPAPDREEVVCRDQSAELELLLDKITGIANGLTTGSVGSSKVKIIGTVKELKSKIFN